MEHRETTVDRLARDLEWIAVPRHPEASPEGHRAVRERILESLRGSLPGWSVREEPFVAQEDGALLHGVNVVADSPGRDDAPHIVLGAHYDTVPGTPGADDNGSAVAALLESARRLGRRVSAGEGARRLRLVAFDLEERQGGEQGLFGSRAACSAWQSRGDELTAMLCLEMVGYRDSHEHSQRLPEGLGEAFPELVAWLDARSWRGDFLAAVGDASSVHLLRHVSEAALRAAPHLPILPFTTPVDTQVVVDLLRSDHASFWEAGVPALMLTDTSEFRNPHYHGVGDRVETLDLPFLAAVCAVVTATLESLIAAPG